MGRSRRVFVLASALGFSALAIRCEADAAPWSKPAPTPSAMEEDDGPLLAPPSVEVPSGVTPDQQAPFREAPVPTWSPGQAAVNAQQRTQTPPRAQLPRGIAPAYGAPVGAAGEYNEIPTIEESTQQPALQPKPSRNPLAGKKPTSPNNGYYSQPSAGAKPQASTDPAASRKPSRWNPFSKQEKPSTTTPAPATKKRLPSYKSSSATAREEAPLYQAEPGAQAYSPTQPYSTSPMTPQPEQPAKPGWRWPWSK